MPIGKNSISRVAGEPIAEPEVKTPAPAAEKKPAAKTTTTKSTATKSTATKSATTKSSGTKTAAKSTTAKKPAAPKPAKSETVERIETVAATVTEAAKEAPKTEEVKAYVTITDELPTYLL